MPSRVEQLFFRDSRAALCELFRIQDPAEIDQVERVELPQAVIRPMSNAVKETIHDLEARERDLTFKYQDGVIILAEKLIGSEFKLDALISGGIAGVSTERSLLAELGEVSRAYFGKPKLIAAHTHPSLSVEFFHQHGIRVNSTYMIKDRQIALKMVDFIDFFNEFAYYPSSIDLRNLVSNVRYWRSQLVGSQRGYIFVVNPSLSIPLVARATGTKHYDHSSIELGLNYMADFTKGSFQRDEFHRDNQRILRHFANQNGLLVFLNDDYQNPTLKRLR